MATFQLIITRDITESTFLTVEAKDANEAEKLGMEKLRNQDGTVWEVDDLPAKSEPYITGVTEE